MNAPVPTYSGAMLSNRIAIITGAAQGLGASWMTAVRRITLPQIRPALISAAFIIAMT